MSITIWDKLATLTPTRDAAVATSGGETFLSAIKPSSPYHWKAPPELRPNGPNITNQGLLGLRRDRLVVLGVLHQEGKTHKAVWACRCQCGDYTAFTAKALRSTTNAGTLMCPDCSITRHLQFRAALPSTSKTREKSAKALDRMVRA